MKEKFEKYLESIGGLKNGYFPDKEPIKSRHFFSVGDGWLDLIKKLIEELIVDGWNREICQVKEKFAGLRFYTNGGGENHYEIISKYERLSMEICEVCGNPGSVRNIGWMYTLCDSHYIEQVIEKFKTKYKEGFTYSEIDELLKYFPNINMKKYNEAMICNTCMIIDGESIIYHCDVRTALYCGVENRNLRTEEFD